MRKLVKLIIDNKSAINLSKNPMLHGRSKHIDTKYHILQNQAQNEVLEVVHYRVQKQFTYMPTETIKTEHFINLRDEIGVIDINCNN